jgi:hypothetical protein
MSKKTVTTLGTIKQFECDICGYRWSGLSNKCPVCKYIKRLDALLQQYNLKSHPKKFIRRGDRVEYVYEKLPNVKVVVETRSQLLGGIWINRQHASWSVDLAKNILKEILCIT